MMHIMKGCLNIEPYAQVQLVLPCPICHRSKHCLHSSLLVGKMTRIKCFRVLTGWLVGSQVFEMDAFDDLHRQTSCGGVVHQADKDLWCGCLTDWLEWWGAFTACHIWEADLGFTALKCFTQNCSLVFVVVQWMLDCRPMSTRLLISSRQPWIFTSERFH